MSDSPGATTRQPPYLAVRRFETKAELRNWHGDWLRRAPEALDGFVSPVEGVLSPELRERLLADGRYLAAVDRGMIDVWNVDVTDLAEALEIEGPVEILMTTATAWGARRESFLVDVVAW